MHDILIRRWQSNGRLARFRALTLLGYAGIVLLLTGGMVLTAWRFDVAATTHVNRIRHEENQITLAERLRWSGEAVVSAGRGYLITGDPAFLARLDEAKTAFDRGIAELDRRFDGTSGSVTEIEADGASFRARQELLVETLQQDGARTIATRFENELVPLQKKLGHSLDRLIQEKEGAIDAVYEKVARERTRLRASLHVLLAILVVASLLIAGYVATVLSSSFRKEQEARTAARRAVEARDEIMGVIAHDLRNPLSSISMRAELMRETATTEGVRKHAAAITTVIESMEALIRTMLDVTTIETGHFTVNPAPVAVDALLKATTDMFACLAAPKQVALIRGSLPDVDVRADRERVLQVLGNLVGNALKFTPAGGRVEIGATKTEAGVELHVSDSGPGIAPDHLPHVFDRFWKYDVGAKKGTGLGLFIAKGIVEAHCGRIWVESTSRGATFRFVLPYAESPRAS